MLRKKCHEFGKKELRVHCDRQFDVRASHHATMMLCHGWGTGGLLHGLGWPGSSRRGLSSVKAFLPKNNCRSFDSFHSAQDDNCVSVSGSEWTDGVKAVPLLFIPLRRPVNKANVRSGVSQERVIIGKFPQKYLF
jgi:hypothetical protein